MLKESFFSLSRLSSRLIHCCPMTALSVLDSTVVLCLRGDRCVELERDFSLTANNIAAGIYLFCFPVFGFVSISLLSRSIFFRVMRIDRYLVPIFRVNITDASCILLTSTGLCLCMNFFVSSRSSYTRGLTFLRAAMRLLEGGLITSGRALLCPSSRLGCVITRLRQ